MQLVMRAHFRSRDKDGAVTPFSPPYPKRPATCKLHGFMFYRTGVTAN